MTGLRVLAALHLYSPHHNAGAETMVHAMLRALVEAGHQVVVQLSMPHPMHHVEPYSYEGVQVVPYRAPDQMWRWATGSPRPDLIVTHLDTAVQACMLGQLTRIPVVDVIHNTHDLTKRNLLRGSRLAVYNTHWVRADFETWARTWGVDLPDGIVIHPPIWPQQYATTVGDCITLVNLTEPKGARVFYALAERFPRRQFLGVLGAYGEQIIRTDLPNVTIHPHVAAHDMAQLVYSRTRVLLAPSSYESYGRVVIEAGASGIPAIMHPTPGLREAMGADGLYCDRADLDGWAAVIRRLGHAKAWATASVTARAAVDRLDTAGDLARWVAMAEMTARAAPLPV